MANIFETSVDLLIGMDVIRAEETRYNIHKTAADFQRKGDYDSAEKVYRDALLIYLNKPGMILGLAGVLALKGKSEEAAELTERGLHLSVNEKQKATMRAALCFLYLKCGKKENLYYFSMRRHGTLCPDCLKGEYAVPLDASTLYALQYVITAPLQKLYSFTLSAPVLGRLEEITVGYIRQYQDHEFQSAQMLDSFGADLQKTAKNGEK